MGKLDDAGDRKARDEAPEEPAEDTEGHLFLPRDEGIAQSLAGDRNRDAERRLRDNERQREARTFKQGRPNRR